MLNWLRVITNPHFFYLAIINENYATLELKSMDKLESYVAFSEIPSEMGFFRQLLRVTVIDYLEYYTLSISY